VLWWGRIVNSNDNFDLTQSSTSLSFIFANEVKSTGSFSIKTHNFSEGLSNNHLESLSEEISKTFSIFIEVSGNETLVSGIEEWVESSLLAYNSNLFPLVKSWINTGWVVSTGVEHNA